MGSTAAQGWYLFAFLLGFTLLPAGLFGLGWPFAVIGLGLLVAAFAGFRSIKEPGVPGSAGRERAVSHATLETRTARSF